MTQTDLHTLRARHEQTNATVKLVRATSWLAASGRDEESLREALWTAIEQTCGQNVRPVRFRSPAAEIEAAVGQVCAWALLACFSALDDFLGAIGAPAADDARHAGHRGGVVAQAEGAAHLRGVNIGDEMSNVLDVLELFRLLRNDVAHNGGCVSREAASYSGRGAFAAAWDQFPIREAGRTLHDRPILSECAKIVVRPDDAILASDCCYRVAKWLAAERPE